MAPNLHSILEDSAVKARDQIDLTPLRGKSILVTGATGHIGLNLVAFLRKHCDVAGLVRTPPEVWWHDVDFMHTVEGTYDYIIAAAGYAAPARFLDDAMGTIDANVNKLMDLFRYLKPQGRLLYLSSSEVYALGPRNRPREKDIGASGPDHPRALYIEAKRCGEAICHYMNRNAPRRAVIARVSSTFGPGCKRTDKRVMSQFIEEALDGAIMLKDPGHALRRWLYVADCVTMLIDIMLNGTQPVYNIAGQGEVMSIAALAYNIAKVLNVPIESRGNVAPFMAGAPTIVTPDMALYDKEFCKVDTTDFTAGLQQTIAWHRLLRGAV